MASIPFSTIAASGQIRTNINAIEYDASRAITGRSGRPHKILLMGVKLAAGLQTALTAQRVYSPGEADANAGVGSQLAEMVRYGKAANALGEMWMIPVDPLSGGTAGIRTATVTGPATASGTLHLYIAGEHYVPVAITSGDAQNTIAAAIAAAIQAHGAYARMPFTVTVATNVVTFTQKWKGVDVADVRANYNDGDVTPAGVTVVFALATPGAGNPDITAIITAIAADKYDTIICPWSDATNLTALKTEMTRRWGGQVKKRGHVFIATTGNHAAAVTTGNAHNNPHVSFFPANTSPTPPWLWATVMGCVEAKESHPARPRQSLFAPGLLPPARSEVWTDDQRNTLLFEGASTYVVDESRSVFVERITTTYKSNAQAVDDWTFLDIETPRTLAAIMEDLDQASSLTWPRHLLQDDGGDIPLGLPVVTPKRFKAFVISRFDLWLAAGWVESSSRAQFILELVVIRPDDSRTRLEVDFGPNLMNQFRGMSAKASFIL